MQEIPKLVSALDTRLRGSLGLGEFAALERSPSVRNAFAQGDGTNAGASETNWPNLPGYYHPGAIDEIAQHFGTDCDSPLPGPPVTPDLSIGARIVIADRDDGKLKQPGEESHAALFWRRNSLLMGTVAVSEVRSGQCPRSATRRLTRGRRNL